MPYIIRGVDWSPASPETQTSPTDPNNANVRRPEFGKWATTDIPLMAVMNVNTVRLFMDPGFDQTLGPIGLAILDKFYSEDIMVIMTVDDAINDLHRVRQAVDFYKDHPAILMWMLGSEWNINRYFGVASSVQDAARRTETAAALIKMLDPNHPVATSYGDIDINADGLRLADTQNYVNNVCPSVDVWGLNIYRAHLWHTIPGLGFNYHEAYVPRGVWDGCLPLDRSGIPTTRSGGRNSAGAVGFVLVERSVQEPLSKQCL